MAAVLGSVALTRNKLWIYNEQMELNGKIKPFTKTYNKWVEFTDAMAQQVGEPPRIHHHMTLSSDIVQVLQYHVNLVATVVLCDPEGQDWENTKSFQEGEKISTAIQFW